MKKRFTDEQIIGMWGAEVGATTIKALCKEHNVTEQTFFRWQGVLPRGPGSDGAWQLAVQDRQDAR